MKVNIPNISDEDVRDYEIWKPLLNCYAIYHAIPNTMSCFIDLGVKLFDAVFNAERPETGLIKQLWSYYSKKLSIKITETKELFSGLKQEFFELYNKQRNQIKEFNVAELNLGALIYSIAMAINPNTNITNEPPRVKVGNLLKPKRFKNLKHVLESELKHNNIALEQLLELELDFEEATNHHILDIESVEISHIKSNKILKVDTITLPYVDTNQTSQLLFFNNSQDFDNYRACKLLGLFQDPDLSRRESDPRLWVLKSLKTMAHILIQDIKLGCLDLEPFIYGIRYYTFNWMNKKLRAIIKENNIEHKITGEHLLKASYNEIIRAANSYIDSYNSNHNIEGARIVNQIKNMFIKSLDIARQIENPTIRDMQLSLATWRAVTLMNQQKLSDFERYYKEYKRRVEYWYQQYINKNQFKQAVHSAALLAYTASKQGLILNKKTLFLWSLTLAELIIRDKHMLDGFLDDSS